VRHEHRARGGKQWRAGHDSDDDDDAMMMMMMMMI
jgi:hypothetical protein